MIKKLCVALLVFSWWSGFAPAQPSDKEYFYCLSDQPESRTSHISDVFVADTPTGSDARANKILEMQSHFEAYVKASNQAAITTTTCHFMTPK